MSGDHHINRRAVLWNVQQPGDAYDIRKSMIARLPQHPARFMGDNLQLVCLFQAAQIQRLAQFLDEMTLQMRAIQRIQLDRHSYQVQIKELAEKLQVANQFKSENAKLREFIKGQSEQLQNLQRYRNSSQNLIELQTKYQSVLNQLRISRENYSALQRTNNQSLREIAQWRFKCEKLQKSIYQERQVKQREIKISIQKTTLQLRSFYQSKQYQLKGEINVMKQNLVLKNRQIQLQKSKNTQISKLLAQKQELLGKYARGQIQVQTNKTQQFLRISRKLQQSTYYLQQKQKNILNLKDQVTYLNKKIKTIEDQLKRKQEEIRKKQDQIRQKDQQLNRKNQQLQSRQNTFNNNPQLLFRISEHQKRIILLTSEIERLNQILNVKNNQSIDKQKQIMFYKEKSISYERTVEFLQKQIKEKQTFLKKHEYDSHIFQDKDNKIAALGGEIQRLNIVMREKLNQMSRMENRINQLNQSYNQQFNLLRARQEAIKILQDKCRDYDMKIISLQDANKLNFDEFNRLNLKLAGVQNHNIQLRREIDSRFQISSEMNQLQNQISNLNEEINKRNVENKKLREDNQIMFKEIHQLEEKIRISETNLNEIRMTTNQMLFEKDHQIKDLQFTFSQNEKAHLQKIDLYLNSMPKMTTEIDRLHQLIQRRQIQLKKLQQDLEIQRQKNRLVQRRNSTQSEMRILQYERTISFYESKCKNLQKINSDMSAQKNFIIEKVQSLQVKLRESQTQFDKIMTALKVKDATFNEHQKNASILQTAINQLRQENLRLQSQCLKSRQQLQLNFQMTRKIQYELDLCRRQFSKCQTNNSGFNEENMRLKGMIEQSQLKNSGLMQTIQSLRHKLSVYENEKQYLMQEINDKKMRLQVYEQDLRGLQSKISSHQQSLKHTEQANSVKIEQMRQRLIQEYDIRLKNQASKYHKLQDMYRQVQGAYNKEIGGNQQTIKKVQDLQSKNSELIRYLDEYQQKVFSYEQRFALLSQQIQRLSIQNRQWRGRDERVTRNDAAQGQQIRVLKQQLEGTRIEVGNLRLMLNELQSINEHAIAQRDELFVITHEQQGMVGNLRYEINTLQNELLQYRSSQQMVQNEQTIRLREEYNIVRNEFSVLKQEYNKVCNELQMVSRERQNISQYSINLQKQSKALHILQSQSNQYRQQIVVFREENTVLKQQNTVLKQQIVVLKQQNTTLRQQISSLQQEIRTLQQKLSSQQDLFIQVEQLKTAYINIKLQNQQLNRMLQQMQQQLFQSKQLNQQTNRQQQQQQQQQQYQQQQQQEYQRVINENTQLKTILQQQRHTLLILQQKLNTLSAQIQHANTNYTLQINTLSNTITMLQQQNTQLKQQLQNTKIQLTQYTVYQQISTELQAKYNNLYQAYQETYNIYNLLKQEHQNTIKNLHLTQNKIQKLNQEFNTLNQIVEKLKQQINILNQQNRQLQANSALNQNTYQQIIQNNQHLKKQLQRLYQLNSDLTNQVSQIRLRLCDQHTLQQKIKQNMILFVIMCAQIQSLRKRLYQTEHQCEQVRRSSISPLKPKK